MKRALVIILLAFLLNGCSAMFTAKESIEPGKSYMYSMEVFHDGVRYHTVDEVIVVRTYKDRYHRPYVVYRPRYENREYTVRENVFQGNIMKDGDQEKHDNGKHKGEKKRNY
jgi:hypothetical protein